MDDTFVQKMTTAYIQACNEQNRQERSSELLKEAVDLVNLILADYQLHINQQESVKTGLKNAGLKDVIDGVLKDTSLSSRLEPLCKLLLIKNDRVAKQVVKAIQRCLYQYQSMMARSLSSDQIVRFKYFDEGKGAVEEH